VSFYLSSLISGFFEYIFAAPLLYFIRDMMHLSCLVFCVICFSCFDLVISTC